MNLQNVEAENAIIGALLCRRDAAAHVFGCGLDAAAFTHPANSLIFKAAKNLFLANQTLDLITVGEELQQRQALDQVGGYASLAGRVDDCPLPSTVPHYCKIVQEKHTLRSLRSLGVELVEKCNSGLPLDEVLDSFSDDYFNLLSARTITGSKNMETVVDDVYTRVERVRTTGERTGLECGLYPLDRRWNGLNAGDLYILAARPSMGKTALALNMARHVAKDHMVHIFSLEMSAEKLAMRLLADASGINGDALRKGSLSGEEIDRLRHTRDEIRALHMQVDDTPGLHISELVARARSFAGRGKTALVVVDYLQLLRATAENRTNEIGQISATLKGLAKTLGCPVLALSQLNRSLESRPDKTPLLSDLRESGAIEQDADVILFIYRDDYYNKAPDNPMRGLANLITAKNRDGPTGTDEFCFEAHIGRFTPNYLTETRRYGY